MIEMPGSRVGAIKIPDDLGKIRKDVYELSCREKYQDNPKLLSSTFEQITNCIDLIFSYAEISVKLNCDWDGEDILVPRDIFLEYVKNAPIGTRMSNSKEVNTEIKRIIIAVFSAA